MARARKPFCTDCGSADCHVVTRGDGNIWLCGSCEILRENPTAQKATVPPGLPSKWRKPRGKPQKEQLF